MRNQILNEAMYLKDAKYQLKMESIVSDLINEAKNNNGFKKPIRAMNNDPRILELNKLIAAKFNFEGAEFRILPEKNYLNGYTIPFYYDFNPRTNAFKGVKQEFVGDDNFAMIEDKYGLRYKDSKNKFVFMAFSQFLFITLTVEEVMAIIFHEIGHNFYIVNHKKRQLMDSYYGNKNSLKLVAILKKIVVDKDIKGGFEIISGIYKAYQLKKSLNGSSSKVVDFIYNNFISKIQSSISANNTTSLLLLPLNLILFPLFYLSSMLNFKSTSFYIKLFKDYDNEIFSDNFAISYGYAKPIVSLFTTGTKFTTDFAEREDLGVIGSLLQFNSALYSRAFVMNDEHQLDNDRVKMALIKLRYELANNKNLSKEQIEHIKTTLSESETLLKELASDKVKGQYFRTLEMMSTLDKNGLDAKKNSHQMSDNLEDIFDSTGDAGILDPYVNK